MSIGTVANTPSTKPAAEGSFAQAFEAIFGGQTDKFRPGQIVRGKVVAVNKDFVTVDIGFKTDGVIKTEEFTSTDGKIDAPIGNELDAFIISLEGDSGQVILSREKAEQKKVWEHLETVAKADTVIDALVTLKVKGGLQVDIGIPAYLPTSQIDVRPQRGLDRYVGTKMPVKIIKIGREKGTIIVSHKAYLLSERAEMRTETLKVLSEGVIIEGSVKNLTEYGAFVDLGGIDGLLHVSDVTWGRINHPSEKLNVGQVVQVVVLKYDKEKERVSLGMKQLRADPWITAAEQYQAGKRVKGRVTMVTDYGCFVELEDGLEGLVHVSEMSWSKKQKTPSKIVTTGDLVDVQVLEVNSREQRIALGMKQLQPNPWDKLRDQHPVGSRVKGLVRSITDFGVFVGIDDDIDGLVHVSDISWTKRVKDPKELHTLFKKGDEVEAVVLGIDVDEERLSLGIKQLGEDPWNSIAQRYPVGSRVKGTVTSIAEFGVFVDIGDGIEGLIHNTQLGLERGEDVAAAYPNGKEIEAEVIRVEREERRMSLSAKAVKSREEGGQMIHDYMGDDDAPLTLGQLIQGQLSKDK